jgi:hypothetical protein
MAPMAEQKATVDPDYQIETLEHEIPQKLDRWR